MLDLSVTCANKNCTDITIGSWKDGLLDNGSTEVVEVKKMSSYRNTVQHITRIIPYHNHKM